jgi:hypothetical protein
MLDFLYGLREVVCAFARASRLILSTARKRVYAVQRYSWPIAEIGHSQCESDVPIGLEGSKGALVPVIIAITLLVPSNGYSQDYPTRPIRLIVPSVSSDNRF